MTAAAGAAAARAPARTMMTVSSSSQLRRLGRAAGLLSGELQQRQRRTLVCQRAQICLCGFEHKEWKKHRRRQRRIGVQCHGSSESTDDTDKINGSSNDNKNRKHNSDGAKGAEGKKPKFMSAKILDALLVEVNELEAQVAALDARRSNSESLSSEAARAHSEFRKTLFRPIVDSVAPTSDDGNDGHEKKENEDKEVGSRLPGSCWSSEQ